MKKKMIATNTFLLFTFHLKTKRKQTRKLCLYHCKTFRGLLNKRIRAFRMNGVISGHCRKYFNSTVTLVVLLYLQNLNSANDNWANLSSE